MHLEMRPGIPAGFPRIFPECGIYPSYGSTRPVPPQVGHSAENCSNRVGRRRRRRISTFPALLNPRTRAPCASPASSSSKTSIMPRIKRYSPEPAKSMMIFRPGCAAVSGGQFPRRLRGLDCRFRRGRHCRRCQRLWQQKHGFLQYGFLRRTAALPFLHCFLQHILNAETFARISFVTDGAGENGFDLFF